jgi:glycosyltransferase involved in cell wall biosynthesis
VHREGLLECHAEADIFVFPSLYEGFGLALLEAMASALPIVTTAVGVAADALRDREDAVLVPKRDPAALVGAVERLIADQALRERLGAAARRRALDYRERDRVRELADTLIGLGWASSPGAARPQVAREDQNPQNRDRH